MTAPSKLRCAIYTRKSSDEGLEQSFNSLHAQREACEAYVRSQKGEGWSLLRTQYDDGGFSGGSMERPALRALMAEIEAGRVDVVVVYKVDRLTRSLMDFARIVEAFDRKSVSFVSVTQSFNTTTSMGRLTLNVLLSFAQFEREVTGERIRDKVAASKAKGMWMGGRPALGYDAQDKALVINPAEASVVQMLFDRYLALGSVHKLKRELDAAGACTKSWISRAGRQYGGQPFSRGCLFHILKNPLYLGQIVHKGSVFEGLHPPIVDAALFGLVQAKLAVGAKARVARAKPSEAAPLKGIVFDQDGIVMSPTVSYGKGGSAYRYYVSTALQQGKRLSAGDDAVRRISAPQLEALVEERLQTLGLADWQSCLTHLKRVQLEPRSIALTLSSALSDKVDLANARDRLGHRSQIERTPTGALRLTIQGRPVFRGGRTWLVNPNGASASAKSRIDAGLIAALRKAHAGLAQHHSSPTAPIDVLRTASSPTNSFERKRNVLAFLAPDIQLAIVQGRQPPGLTAQQIIDHGVPLAWVDQRSAFGFPCSPIGFP